MSFYGLEVKGDPGIFDKLNQGANSARQAEVQNMVNQGQGMDAWFKKQADGFKNWLDQKFGNSPKNHLAYTDDGIAYDPTSADSYIAALNQGAAYKRDDTRYQRLVADLKAAGINPALVLGNAAASESSSASVGEHALDNKEQINSALKLLLALAAMVKAAG